MKAIICLALFYFAVTSLCVCKELEKHFHIKDLSGTNLTYGQNYFIKLSSNNNYLRYDGNNNGDVSGLAFVSQTDLTNSTDESRIRSYIFVIEQDVNNLIKIKNVLTNRYISYYSSAFGFALSTSNSAYNSSLRPVIHAASNSLDLLSGNSYFSASYTFRITIWINTVSTATTSTTLQFIVAPNITQTTPPAIGDTDLAFGQNYFIKNASNDNFIRWDGNTIGAVSGLTYVTQNDVSNIITDQSYQFVIESDINNMIRLRNMQRNLYLFYNTATTGYLLSNNTPNTSFRLVLNPATNSLYLANPSVTTYYYLSPLSTFNTPLYLYLIPRLNTISYFQFISGSQPQPGPSTTTTTTITTTPTTPLPTPAPCLATNYVLRAVVGRNLFDSPYPEDVDDATETIILSPRTVINNTSPGSLTQKIFFNENVEEVYRWFYPSLTKLNIKIEQNGVTLPPIVRRNIAVKNSIENIVNSRNTSDSIEIVYNRVLSIDSILEVKPQTAIEYIIYDEYIKSLGFNFTSLAKISGNDTSNNELTGDELSGILQNCGNFTVVEVNDKSIVVVVNGLLVADLIAGFFFEVNSEWSDSYSD